MNPERKVQFWEEDISGDRQSPLLNLDSGERSMGADFNPNSSGETKI